MATSAMYVVSSNRKVISRLAGLLVRNSICEQDTFFAFASLNLTRMRLAQLIGRVDDLQRPAGSDRIRLAQLREIRRAIQMNDTIAQAQAVAATTAIPNVSATLRMMKPP